MKCSNYKKEGDEDGPDLRERHDEGSAMREQKGSNVSHFGPQEPEK